jgi:hypothetical protein
MSFIKLGELIEINGIENPESCIPAVSAEVLENFRKTAASLKKIAPKAEDFLYFSAVMMHAAEAAGLNDDGTPKLNARGEQVQVGWDKRGGTWRWTSNDPSIKPYKNSNGDIFPEEELVKAYKKWVHKPLCIDHKSSSVDHTRGFIVDTYYDRSLKRVIALCALDKANYPELARKVSTGMQTAVSMGTAVGRAICSDCATVARAEADFCDHMRRKSCYGEINVDLNPIELSIVVNGADPRANIKHIIASATTLNSYVDTKVQELKKIADLQFSATFSVTDPMGNEGKQSAAHFEVDGHDLETFKKEVDGAFARLAEIAEQAKKTEQDTNDSAFNQSSGSISMDEGTSPNTDSGLAPPHARYASVDLNKISVGELLKLTATIETKLNHMKQNLDKLAKSNVHEENMSMNKKSYYQGTEEPTPGQAKYPKDPGHMAYEDDKHMHGQSPFPGVGPVDGLHPSPDSAEQSNELERKKMLARAEAEERAMKRQSIVNLAKQALEDKKAYFNNGEGPNNPNTPTPGKTKYPVDKGHMAYEDDKHMHGQKPFPGVGSVDGLHPSPDSAEISDELKRKELLRRANTLHGRFVTASKFDGTRDINNSAWEIRLGDRLLLTASVKDLSGGRSEMMYDTINTAEFGKRLLEKVKVFGADKVSTLFKNAQDPNAAAPVAAPASGPADAGPLGNSPAEDTGKSGDPKESALEMAEKVRDMSSDLVEAVRALTGEQAEMGADMAAPGMAATASDFSSVHMHALRGEINGSLNHAMREVVAELEEHQEELDTIVGLYDKGAVTASNEELIESLLDDATVAAKSAVADGFRLMTAFVKYARGTKAIIKRAEIEAELNALSDNEGDTTMSGGDDSLMALIDSTNSDLNSVREMMDENGEPGLGTDGDGEGFDGLEEQVSENDGLSGDGLSDLESDPLAEEGDDLLADDDNDLMAKKEELKDLDLKPGTTVQVTAGFNSRASRAALRAKLAADALGSYGSDPTGKQDDGQLQDASKIKFYDMLDTADSQATTSRVPNVDNKSSDNLDVIETLPEINKAMLDLAKAPPKVRKEAEAIHKLVSEGKLDRSDLDALVAEGLDKDAVSYYKKYYGQTDGGGEFASELVKEHVKAQLEEELNRYKVKMARAYEVAYDMVDRGLCHNDKIAVASQVEEIMKFNDDSFDTLKRVVAKHSPVMRKEAGRMPQVGLFGSGENTVASPAEDDWSLLSAAFAKTSKRMF